MEVYALKDNKTETLNALGELQWRLIVDDERLLAKGFPILIGKDFTISEDSAALNDIAIRWLNGVANAKSDVVPKLRKYGFTFEKVHSEAEGKKVWRLVKEGEALFSWRLEVNLSDTPCYAYITFGDPMLNAPCLANAEVIDSAVPKEIIDEALASGSILKIEYKENDA